MKYRREIDGLRALAVFPVILFHAGFQSFSGGYVGVDVFFVISGYLITTIIVSDLKAGSFSIVNFYERRARRILPALFFVMFVCIVFAWLWLLPEDMRRFSQSLVAVSTFASNVLFWLTSGYFESDAELKPLLHTWSLAVEEQYYVFFPLFLMLTWRFGKQRLLSLLAILLIVSLLLADLGSRASPAAAFYLLPTRGWELLVGVFAAFVISGKAVKNLTSLQREVGGLFGLTLVLWSIFVFDEQTPFPSVYTLVPTIGTALIAICSSQQTSVGRFLGNRVLVGVGVVSYSAYLWHQPLLAYAKYTSLDKPSESLVIGLIALSMALAVLSWRYVERPFRDKGRFSRAQIFGLSFVATSIFLLVGLVGHYFADEYKSLWLSRQSPDVRIAFNLIDNSQQHSNLITDADSESLRSSCRFNAEELNDQLQSRILSCFEQHGAGTVILGDSHAVDLVGVALAGSKDHFVIGVTRVGCRPGTRSPRCQYEEFLEFVRRNGDVLNAVIYEQAAFYLLRTSKARVTRKMFSSISLDSEVNGIFVDQEQVQFTVDYLRTLSEHVRVIWFGPRIEPHFKDTVLLEFGCEYPYTLRPNQREIFDSLDRYVDMVVGDDPNFKFVSQNKSFEFQFPRDFTDCSQKYWSDGDHLSAYGETYFGARFDVIGMSKD